MGEKKLIRILSHSPSEKKESGIAIILAISISALLIMLALTFLTSSIIERKATRNNDAMTVARMAAQSALNRAIVSMKQVSKNTLLAQEDVWSHHDVVYDYSNGYMSSIADSAIYYDDLDSSLTTTVNDVEMVNSINASNDYDVTSKDAKTWIYLPLPSGYNSYPLAARIAYVVVADKGKIDPSAAVDSGLNAMMLGYPRGQGVSESNEPLSGLSSDGIPDEINKEITMINPDGSYVIGRPGRDVSELFLRCLGSETGSLWFKQVFDQKLSSLYSPAGRLNPGSRWKDFKELYGAINILNSQGKVTDITAANGFHNVFYLDNPPDAEAYWINNGDELKEESELYHRFNLMRLNWDDLSVDSIISEPQKFGKDIPDNDIYSINWIRNWKSLGDFPSIDAAKRQIAANLIDYNDSNDIATANNIDPANNNDSPTYVGLEKVPYINEVIIRFHATMQAQDLISERRYSASIVPEFVAAESINMYDVISGGSTFKNIHVILNMDWDYTVADTIYSRTSTDSDRADFIISNSDAFRYTSNHYKFNDQSWHSTGWVHTPLPLGECNVTKIRIKSLSAKFINDNTNDFYDYSYIVDTDCAVAGETGNSFNKYFNAKIDDPRQNLFASDWIKSFGSIDLSDLSSKNSVCNPNQGGNTDSEPGITEPYNISTAFIRNSRMLSPWELGAIHRTSKWQTINLKNYNSAESMTGGGNSYSDGDANILDQIKMTDKKQIYGKISINSKNLDVMRVLFQKIRIGSGYLVPGWLTAYEVNANIAQNLANNLITYNGSYKNRTEFLGTSTLVNLFTNYNSTGGNLQQTNDAKKEELLGKFINLTKATEANLFTIIAVGQAIKDVGGATVYKDLNTDGDTNDPGEQIQTVTGRFDINADEILSTQKIMATVQRSSSGDTFRIQKFQYIDMD